MNRQAEHCSRKHQHGVVVVLVAIAMLALLAMAGFALDGGHLLLNKTRLQNAVDASALSAARAMADLPPDTAVATIHSAATAAAEATFLSNLGLSDNSELMDAYDTTISVQFSTSLNPFNPESDALPYVRVIADNFDLDVWLLQVVGIGSKPVSASAVAGPIGLNANVCDMLPIVACGCDSVKTDGDTTDDCPEEMGESYFGYPPVVDEYGNIDVPENPTSSAFSLIKLSSGSPSDVGPGNFRLLRLDGTGGSDLRQALAGLPAECAAVDGIEEADTEPGNKVGPVAQGLNTRFGMYQGGGLSAATAPPDPVISTYFSGSTPTGPTPTNPNKLVWNGYDADGKPVIGLQNGGEDYSHIFDYHDYQQAYAGLSDTTCSDGSCGLRRRELVLPIGQCDASISGTSENIPIYTVGCFFLLQDVALGGDAEVFGQFFGSGCSATGTFTDTPANPGAPSKIVLFRDVDGEDS